MTLCRRRQSVGTSQTPFAENKPSSPKYMERADTVHSRYYWTNPPLFYTITITSTNFSVSPPSIGAGSYSISSIDLTSYNPHTNTGATITHVVSIPEASFLNGSTRIPASRGLLLAFASPDGKTWLTDVRAKTIRSWLKERLLKLAGFDIGRR
ncbi:hypothetical protein WAI453_010154 [Rhynchosporium graminicola]